MSTAYETDIAWSREQAELLRAGRLSALDIEHIADGVEDVGRCEQRELASRMAGLLAHLLKWPDQPANRGASWRTTIRCNGVPSVGGSTRRRAYAPASPTPTGRPTAGWRPGASDEGHRPRRFP